VQVAAAWSLGELGDPGAVVPLYEVASDSSLDAGLRRTATGSLERLGFKRREDSGPPAILAWVAGLVVIAGSLWLATVIGPVAIVPLLAGMAIIVAYYVREARKAGAGDWYVGPDGGDFYIPGDVPNPGGWLGDLFGGAAGGGGGNGGS
jgi:hypothetical protein